MHYYSLEWYLKSRCIGLYTGFTECSHDEARSAEFFEKILAQFTDEIRFECEQIKNTSYDVFAEDRTEDEETLKAEFADWKTSHNPEEADFYAAAELSERITRLKTILPAEIISKIPDIRIFTLKKAEREIIDLITDYSDKCRQFVNETDFSFENEYNARTEPIPGEIWKEYGFAGAKINKIVRKGRDISFYFDNSTSDSLVTAMHLKDVDTERLDDSLEGAEWICNEIYLSGGEYELCALCRNKTKFPEFILHAREISFDYD